MPTLYEIDAKLDCIVKELEEMHKNQKETTETLAMLATELEKLQNIVRDALK